MNRPIISLKERTVGFGGRKALALVAAMATLAFASSCSTVAEKVVEKPKVDLAQVGLRDVGLKGATILFALKVENPNPFALKVGSLKYDLQLGGKAFTSGTLDKGAEVPAGKSAMVEIPVAVNYTDVFSSMSQFLRDGTTTYTLTGEAQFGFIGVPFSQSGKLDLNQ